MNEPASPPSFREIRGLIADLPGPDLDAQSVVATREAMLTKPPGALGRLEEITAWLAAWQARPQPEIRRPRICVFAGNHGVAARGVSPFPAAVTEQMVQNFINGGAAVNQLAEVADADLRVFELDLDAPTGDIAATEAMSETECARAMTYGMMAVEAGLDLLVLGEMGIANTALAAGLFGGDAADWVGPGTGATGAVLEAKRAAVEAALALHRPALEGADALEALRRLGGLEFAAIAGAVLAARLARTPVLLDGFAATVAAAVIYKLDPRGLDHCLVAHRSAEPGHDRLLRTLEKRPLFDLEMRLGEASGAALAIPVIRAAAACHAGMATFAEAGVATG